MSDEYDVLELIGRGSFGQIRKVRRKSDGLILVRKEISYVRMSPKEREQLQSEFGILSTVRHPNIVQYFQRDHIKSECTIHLYMEYCGNGDLSKVIKQCQADNTLVPEAMVWAIFSQITMALYRCHYGVDPPPVSDSYGEVKAPAVPKGAFTVLHRDLKPENIFLDEDNSVKLGDFGLSKILTGEHHLATTYVGTPFYMSPELICDLPYTSRSDIWSLGCVMYELCKLSPPFNAKTHYSLCQKIKEGKFAPIPSQYSRELQNVIASCLKINAKDRPDTAQLLNLEPVRYARREAEAVQIRKMLRLREEKILLKESQLAMREKELEKEYNTKGKVLDAQLREKWALAAEAEIQRQIAARLPGLVEEEVARRLAEMRPHTPTSLFSSTQSLSPPANNHYSDEIIPPSPMDVHMMSPAPPLFESPRRRSTEDSPFNSPLKRPALFSANTAPLRPTIGLSNNHVLNRLNSDANGHLTSNSTPNLSNMMGGLGFESPTKLPGSGRRKTHVLQPTNPNLPHNGPFFSGATVKGKSLVELAKEKQRMQSNEMLWDPERDEMPSPFIKRTLK